LPPPFVTLLFSRPEMTAAALRCRRRRRREAGTVVAPPGIPATPGSTSATRRTSGVVRWNPTTHARDVVTTGADTPDGALGGPDFLNFSPNGTLYVSDNNKHVYSFTITG
jgi:sugar lactone lactonase YvrE